MKANRTKVDYGPIIVHQTRQFSMPYIQIKVINMQVEENAKTKWKLLCITLKRGK